MYERDLVNGSFSFFLTYEPNAKGSKLILGGYEQQYFTGNLTWVDLSMEAYWMTNMSSVMFNGTDYGVG